MILITYGYYFNSKLTLCGKQNSNFSTQKIQLLEIDCINISVKPYGTRAIIYPVSKSIIMHQDKECYACLRMKLCPWMFVSRISKQWVIVDKKHPMRIGRNESCIKQPCFPILESSLVWFTECIIFATYFLKIQCCIWMLLRC